MIEKKKRKGVFAFLGIAVLRKSNFQHIQTAYLLHGEMVETLIGHLHSNGISRTKEERLRFLKLQTEFQDALKSAEGWVE